MPRKKKEEETQPEAEATEELVSEQTPAEAPAEEEKPKKRAPRKKAEVAEEAPAPEAEVAEVSEGETERVGAAVEADAAPAEETPAVEEAPAAEEAPAPDEGERAGSVMEEEPAPAAEAEPPAAEEVPAEADAPVAEAAPEPVAAPVKKKRKRLPRAERRQRPKAKRPATTERKPIVRLPKPEHERGQRKERRGIVVSSVMDKTIVVRVETVKPHPVYKKIVRRSTKFHAHDERNVAKTGDLVRIVESRPHSKTKNWRLVEVLEEAK